MAFTLEVDLIGSLKLVLQRQVLLLQLLAQHWVLPFLFTNDDVFFGHNWLWKLT